jgi:hypothetical protein
MCHNTPQVCQCNPKKLLNVNGVLEQAGYVKKKEWVGLTDKEMMQCYDDIDWDSDQDVWLDFGENVQAKLKEKNT